VSPGFLHLGSYHTGGVLPVARVPTPLTRTHLRVHPRVARPTPAASPTPFLPRIPRPDDSGLFMHAFYQHAHTFSLAWFPSRSWTFLTLPRHHGTVHVCEPSVYLWTMGLPPTPVLPTWMVSPPFAYPNIPTCPAPTTLRRTPVHTCVFCLDAGPAISRRTFSTFCKRTARCLLLPASRHCYSLPLTHR